ncbi:MAG: GAF domain-containing protein [Chloroflexota bacterium]|nr:GAF domain-containing protein [Chloroflexota bacterium]
MNIIRALFTVRYPYDNLILRQRAQGMLIIAWMSLIGLVVYMLGVVQPNVQRGFSVELFVNPGTVLLPIVAIAAMVLVQRGNIRAAALVLVSGMAAATIPMLFVGEDSIVDLAVIIPLVAGGVLLGRRSFLLIALVVLGALVTRALWLGNFTEPYTIIPANHVMSHILIPLVTFGAGAVFLYAFSGSAERVTSDALNSQRYLRAIVQQSAAFDPAQSEGNFLTQLVKHIQETFGFANLQIYLTNDQGQLVRQTRLAAGMVASGSSTQAVRAPLVNAAFNEKKTIIADSRQPADRRALITAPARKAIALPLLMDDVLLGIIEIQSDVSKPFTAGEIEALELLTAQTARLLVNGRLFKDVEATARDTQDNLARLGAQMRRQEAEITQSVRSGWDTYLRSQGSALGFDLSNNGSQQLLRADSLPPEMRTVMERGQTMTETSDGVQKLHVPIIYRGELLGAMSFNIPGQQPLTDRQVELARNVAERLGAALDNTRLFEQNRAQAEREQMANAAGNQLLGITDVQALLDAAALGFKDALGAVYARVYVSSSLMSESPRAPQEAS